jgi:hypothetical protein
MKQADTNKTKTRIAIVLVIVAILTVAWSLMPTGGAKAEPAAVTATGPKGKVEPATESLDPRLNLELLASSENVKYEGKGKNIFRAVREPVELPVVKVSPLLAKQEEEKKNLPPPPPPINLKFFGISNRKGEKAKVFLSQGEDVWIAHEGDVVNRHYKIVHISPTAVEVEDLLNNNRQPVPLAKE